MPRMRAAAKPRGRRRFAGVAGRFRACFAGRCVGGGRTLRDTALPPRIFLSRPLPSRFLPGLPVSAASFPLPACKSSVPFLHLSALPARAFRFALATSPLSARGVTLPITAFPLFRLRPSVPSHGIPVFHGGSRACFEGDLRGRREGGAGACPTLL